MYKRVIDGKISELPVRNMDDFIIKVQQDNSEEFLKVIFQVTYGFFDMKPNWCIELEDEFMRQFKFQYTDRKIGNHPARDKGCFEILASSEKTEIVKRIQRAGKKSHGSYVTLELKKNQMESTRNVNWEIFTQNS